MLEDTILAPADFASSLDPDNIWLLGSGAADAAACREMCIADSNCVAFIFAADTECYGRSSNYLIEETNQAGAFSGYLSNCHGKCINSVLRECITVYVRFFFFFDKIFSY